MNSPTRLLGAGLALVAVLMAVPAGAGQPPATLDQLLQQVREHGRERSAENRQREQRFIEQRDQQRALLQQVREELAREERRSEALRADFETRERELGELAEQLRLRVGTLGELFGVARQAAGDTKAVIDHSLVTAQYPQRASTAARLAQIDGLPSMADLNELRILLLDEMNESGKVTRFDGEIIGGDGRRREAEVVRIGVFNAVMGDRFLEYRPETRALRDLARQPPTRYRSLAQTVYDAGPGQIVTMAVDPSRGALLGLLIDVPSLVERIHQGGYVGYTIIALGIIGLLIAAERLLALALVGGRIRSRLREQQPGSDDPLGRILAVYREHQDVDTETLQLKLDEAILRETPLLERRQGYIKVIAAVAPLLGLLGTVVGMIITFQAIVLFGTGDPQLMADGISQALVTTALGLVVAVPLVFLHSVVASRSNTLVEMLEAQSAGIIARHAERAASGSV